MPAPIALFTYNRPHHARRTIEALKANDLAAESDLYLYSDGPRNNGDRLKVEATRRILENVTGFKSVTLVFHEKNRGLSRSIISGVTEVIDRHGRVVVLEDDLVTAPGFLRYMNSALDLYENDENVISIHGYLYPVREKLPETFFLKGADCWGWATWKRGWELFEHGGARLLKELEGAGLLGRFDFEGTYPYRRMLESQIAGRNDSWAIRWYGSALLHGKFTLYPGRSLVSNIGNDGGGTNVVKTRSFEVELSDAVHLERIPVVENQEAYKAFARYFKRTAIEERRRYWLQRIVKSLKRRAKTAVRWSMPPLLAESIRPGPGYGFQGKFPDWASAQAASSGYDSPPILQKVKESILAVKEGRAVFERDSVLFEKPDYSWFLLASLFRVAAEEKGRLSLLDFGGSLGSTYFQCRPLMGGLEGIEWSVVEQGHFVDEGRKTFEDDSLRFYHDIDAVLRERTPRLVLLCSVLAYLPDPHAFLADLIAKDFEYILIEKTRMIDGPEDRLTVQTVQPVIYEAAYPAWFFSEKRLMGAFEGRYHLVGEKSTFEKAGIESRIKSYLFQRIHKQ